MPLAPNNKIGFALMVDYLTFDGFYSAFKSNT